MRVTTSAPAAARRQQALMTGLAYYAESFPAASVSGTQIALTGNVYYQAIGLVTGDVVTNIIMKCQAVGAGQTLVKLGLFKKDGTQLAVSADVKATFLGLGVLTIPMAAAYTVPADDLYYVAFLGVGGTQPTMYRSLSGGNANGAIGTGSLLTAVQTGQADMPSPGTPASSTLAIYYWMAVS